MISLFVFPPAGRHAQQSGTLHRRPAALSDAHADTHAVGLADPDALVDAGSLGERHADADGHDRPDAHRYADADSVGLAQQQPL